MSWRLPSVGQGCRERRRCARCVLRRRTEGRPQRALSWSSRWRATSFMRKRTSAPCSFRVRETSSTNTCCPAPSERLGRHCGVDDSQNLVAELWDVRNWDDVGSEARGLGHEEHDASSVSSVVCDTCWATAPMSWMNRTARAFEGCHSTTTPCDASSVSVSLWSSSAAAVVSPYRAPETADGRRDPVARPASAARRWERDMGGRGKRALGFGPGQRCEPQSYETHFGGDAAHEASPNQNQTLTQREDQRSSCSWKLAG
jgi:hypothetical protein